MPLLEHLDELRSRLFKAALAFLLAFLACSAFGRTLLHVLLEPVQSVLPEGERLAYTRLAEPFMTHLKAAGVFALFVMTPFALYQLWAFVSPGLYRHERSMTLPFLFFGTVFFAGGGFFGYRVVSPVAAAWLVGVGEDFKNVVTMQEAFGFVTRIVLAMGIVFQMPIVIFFLARIGVVTPGFLMKHFRVVVVLIAAVSAVITPPDPMSMALFAGPMVLLYLLGVAVAWASGRKRREAE